MTEVIKEDEGGGGEGGSSNSTTAIAKPDKPMKGDKTMRRTKLEEMIVPNEGEGLNKKRHTMPQISDFDAFMDDLATNEIDVTTVMIKASRLTPTQSNFNEAKVMRMVDDSSYKKGAIITSRDDCVLDGHHRWLAAAQTDDSIRTRRVGMDIEDLLAFVKDKSYVQYKKLHEAKQWAN